MARVALQSFVGAGQRILGLFVVVEPPQLEAIRIVTPPAIGTEPPLVRLVLVTALASFRRVFVCPCTVTFLTWHRRV